MIRLKENERLVYAGTAPLRAPNGTPLPAVPQYMIVSIEEADPAAVVNLQKNDRIVLAGLILHEKKRSEERFAAIKAGRVPPPEEGSIPLYMLMDAENINPKTGLPWSVEKACAELSKDLADLYARQERKKKALAKQ